MLLLCFLNVLNECVIAMVCLGSYFCWLFRLFAFFFGGEGSAAGVLSVLFLSVFVCLLMCCCGCQGRFPGVDGDAAVGDVVV